MWWCVKCEESFDKPTKQDTCPLCGSDDLTDPEGNVHIGGEGERECYPKK